MDPTAASAAPDTPGAAAIVPGRGIAVRCGEGSALLVTRLQPEGKPSQAAADFANGLRRRTFDARHMNARNASPSRSCAASTRAARTRRARSTPRSPAPARSTRARPASRPSSSTARSAARSRSTPRSRHTRAAPIDALDPAARVALRLGAYQLLFLGKPPHAAVGETVALVKAVDHGRASGYVNAVLRALARAPRAAGAARARGRSRRPRRRSPSRCRAGSPRSGSSGSGRTRRSRSPAA